jgi:hypothetical protein
MKNLIWAGLLGVSFQVMAGPIEEAVQAVEQREMVSCLPSHRSVFSKCLGTPATCFYTLSYKCLSEQSRFKLKLKVVESPYEVKVRKVLIIKTKSP